MDEFVSFDFKILSSAETSVSAISSAALFGKGVFTTICIFDGDPFLWEKHWFRLRSNAKRLAIDLTEFSEEKIRDSFGQIVQKNNITHGRGRITIFDESPSQIWPYKSRRKSSLLITTADSRQLPVDFRLTTSPYAVNSLSPLAGIKSCNYLEKILALNEAKTRGFDEAIQLNERGEVASTVMANVFWMSGGRLYTPSLATGCVAGTTCEFVLENIECDEVEAGIEDLDEADAIFLTSAGLCIAQISEFESKKLKKSDHPILHLLPKLI